jgi:hypothetical protein
MPCYQSTSLPSGVTTTGRPSYTTEADCLQACKEGACCDNVGCSVKPQCQCQGATQVFKGVGTTCSAGQCNVTTCCTSQPTRCLSNVTQAECFAAGGYNADRDRLRGSPQACCKCLRVRIDWCGLSITAAGAVSPERVFGKLFDFSWNIGGYGPGPHDVMKELALGAADIDVINSLDGSGNFSAIFETRQNDPTFCGLYTYVFIRFPWAWADLGPRPNQLQRYRDLNNFNRVYAVYANSLGETSITLNNESRHMKPPLSPVLWGWGGEGGIDFRNSIPDVAYDSYAAAVNECGFTTPTVTVLPPGNPLP